MIQLVMGEKKRGMRHGLKTEFAVRNSRFPGRKMGAVEGLSGLGAERQGRRVKAQP